MLDGMNYFCKCVSMSAREFHQMKLKAKYGDDYGNKKDDDKKDGSDAVTTEMKEYTEHEHDHHFHSLGQKLLSKKPISTGCVKKIVRIKNGFKKVPNWLDDSDYQYCDVKFNVVIEVNGNAVVGEIQVSEIHSFFVCCCFVPIFVIRVIGICFSCFFFFFSVFMFYVSKL